MKNVLSVVTFIMGALCFVLFLILVKQMRSVQSPHRASPRIAD